MVVKTLAEAVVGDAMNEVSGTEEGRRGVAVELEMDSVSAG